MIFMGIGIFIKSNKATWRIKFFKDTTGMAATTEGKVNIGTWRIQDQSINAFLKEDGYVVCGLHVLTMRPTRAGVLLPQSFLLVVEIAS